MLNDAINPSNNGLTPTRFHFFSIRFVPYNENENMTSTEILNKVITFISDQKVKHKGFIIDKHKNRTDAERRELFMNYGVFVIKDKRIKCSIALLRNGKQPMLKPADTFDLVPLDKASGSIAEQTHFYIDYSRTPAIICVEYNHNGPRFSDIEYYLRVIAHEQLKLSKALNTSTLMEDNVEETLAKMRNVLKFEIKMQAEKITQMDNDVKGYITAISSLGQKYKPKFVKVEALFQVPGMKIKSQDINKEANNMFVDFLNKFKGRPFHKDCFEHFEVHYEDKDGEEVIFNLIKGKSEFTKDIEANKHPTTSQIYELIKIDFDEFITNRFS